MHDWKFELTELNLCGILTPWSHLKTNFFGHFLTTFQEHKLFGRTKVPIAFDKATETVQPVRELEIKSKSGKTRAVMNLRLTIPKNPNAVVAKEEESNNPFVSAAPAEKFSNPPTPTARNPFNRPKRDDSFRSSTTSVDSQERGSRLFCCWIWSCCSKAFKLMISWGHP